MVKFLSDAVFVTQHVNVTVM